jgi:hypothetical protein
VIALDIQRLEAYIYGCRAHRAPTKGPKMTLVEKTLPYIAILFLFAITVAA